MKFGNIFKCILCAYLRAGYEITRKLLSEKYFNNMLYI